MEKIQLSPKEIAMTQNKLEIYSPMLDFIKYIGKKAAMATKVAPNRGKAIFFVGKLTASYLYILCSSACKLPSTMTMELSTNIPMAMIKAPSDTLCKSIFAKSI